MGNEVEIQDFDGFPAILPEVRTTKKGTPYLQEPGIIMVAKPAVNIAGFREFFRQFDRTDPSLKFEQYVDDTTPLPPAEQLCKIAGQACYASYAPKGVDKNGKPTGRSMNDEAAKYFENIKTSGHGSVLEHPNFTFFFFGVSRSFTHELVRHRAGWGYSQLSQRYVGGKVLRFVERPEYIGNVLLHEQCEARMDRNAEEYDQTTTTLYEMQKQGDEALISGDQKTERRKKVQQVARSMLPNETETHIFATGNVRAWRHVIEMRANPAAEIEIRRVAFRTYLCLKRVAPILFGDYKEVQLPDGTMAVETATRKV